LCVFINAEQADGHPDVLVGTTYAMKRNQGNDVASIAEPGHAQLANSFEVLNGI
jgi:hypothetical protein